MFRGHAHDQHGFYTGNFVDYSWKEASAGLTSTVGDLVKFGNIVLFSYLVGSVLFVLF